jgi:F-type H+-transporting ATPase subunit a
MVPTGPQIYLEAVVGGLNNFFKGILGEEGKRFIPYLGTVAIYIGVANTIGIFGLTPPTKDLNVTVALSVLSILLIEYSGIKTKSAKGWLKSFAEPMPLLAPINFLELFIRPLSLCMRLFGNVLGAFVVMELIKMVIPIIVPVPFSLYFDIFDGLIQTYVFVFLTSLFMKEKME